MSKTPFNLRPWRLSDLPALVKYANNPKIARNMTDGFPNPYTVEDGRAFIDYANQGNPVSIFAIEVNGEAIGGIGLHAQSDIHRRNMELGYWLAEPYWGQGIVTAAVMRMVEFGFEQFDIDRIFSRPFGSNQASQSVLVKAGFKLEGRFEQTLFKNGAYEDELIYAVRK